jgi:uncharacterized DUF497 family protein
LYTQVEWDPRKAKLNARKHGIQFTDAVAVLEDERALTLPDTSSSEEERWVTIGLDPLGDVIVVVYTWRGDNARLISPAKRRLASGERMRKESMKREYDFSKAKRGPVMPVPKGKTRITIRLDDDVIDWFRDQVERAGGGNYQSLINDALRDHMGRSREPLETTLRRVIREEIRRAG